jgi:hypothetical protein
MSPPLLILRLPPLLQQQCGKTQPDFRDGSTRHRVAYLPRSSKEEALHLVCVLCLPGRSSMKRRLRGKTGRQ